MSTMVMISRRSVWRRLLFNPLTTKELRATFRQPRFLVIYWLSLALYSLVVLAVAWGKVSKEALSGGEPVGQIVFNYCVAAQLGLMLFVLPGFAAAAVTDERENQSFDLLVTTALSAFDIVWGKFLACMGYAFLFLSATFPLVCVSVLFTGVRPGEIIFAYAVMTMMAMLMTATGVTASAYGRSSRRSVGVTYVAALAAASAWVGLGYWLNQEITRTNFSKSNLVGFTYDAVFHRTWSSTVWAGVVPLAAWAILLALLFILAVERLKPSSANKATNLRVLGLVLVVLVLGTALTDFFSTQAKLDEMVERGMRVLVLAAVLMAFYLVGAACEEPRLSRRVQKQYRWSSGFKWPLRLLLPGSASGLLYVVLLTAALLGSCAGVLAQGVLPAVIAKTDAAALGRLSQAQAALCWTAGLLGAMVWCYAALGRCLSTWFVGSIYSRTMVLFAFVMANLLPVCLMTLADQAAPAEPNAEHASSLWNLHYASAILSVRSIWDMTDFWLLPERGLFHSRLVIHTGGLDQPVGKASLVIHAALAAVLTLWGAWRQRRIIRPSLTVLSSEPPC